jgi:hypothetical protein
MLHIVVLWKHQKIELNTNKNHNKLSHITGNFFLPLFFSTYKLCISVTTLKNLHLNNLILVHPFLPDVPTLIRLSVSAAIV